MAHIVQAIKDELTFENVLMTALRTPVVKVDRAKFLRKELSKHYSEDVIAAAIRDNPAKAGISKRLVNQISTQVINYETKKVTGVSIVASLPGGAAAVGAAAADITLYFTFILRVVQKLAYLYGFEEFDLQEDDIDSETLNYLLVFIGVMFGVQGASSTLKKLSVVLSKHTAKALARKALTNGTIYPVVKRIATKIGMRMTKQIFADAVASAIPLLGGALSGSLTYAMFKPCCMRLRKNLMSYPLCDPNHYKAKG